jgi:CAAX prenyl protease-like protein
LQSRLLAAEVLPLSSAGSTGRRATMSGRNESGWLPYVVPMFVFLLLVEISGRVTEELDAAMLALRVGVPLGLLMYYRYRGAYAELTWRVNFMTAVDVVVGMALAAMWILPYLLIPQIRPAAEGIALDPNLAGEAWTAWVLSLRMVGFAMVTPVMEELFMRSFVMRYADVYDSDEDFRKVPVGRFSWRSFIVVVVVFLATHMMWEWWVMLPWAVLTNLWFYFRKDLWAIVVVHAATNASILLAAIFASDLLADGAGGKLSLWFFV